MSREHLETLIVARPEDMDPRLGRYVAHDWRSRMFTFPHDTGVRPQTAVRHKIYDPKPLPSQQVGCCTGVDQCIKGNAVGNRKRGTVLDMRTALQVYEIASHLDDDVIPGHYPEQDPGSAALYACKAALQLGLIVRYEWITAGADAVLAALREYPVGVGTWWRADMMHPDPDTHMVQVSGPIVGGHQWTLIGWDPYLNAFEGKCWWGKDFGDDGVFRIGFDDLAELLADDGDAHVTYRKRSGAR